MSDIKKIIEAFAALSRALPGAPHVTIGLHACPDATIRLLQENGAKVQRLDSETEEWDCAVIYADGATISAHGQHRPLTKATVDADAAATALAKAQRALKPAAPPVSTTEEP